MHIFKGLLGSSNTNWNAPGTQAQQQLFFAQTGWPTPGLSATTPNSGFPLYSTLSGHPSHSLAASPYVVTAGQQVLGYQEPGRATTHGVPSWQAGGLTSGFGFAGPGTGHHQQGVPHSHNFAGFGAYVNTPSGLVPLGQPSVGTAEASSSNGEATKQQQEVQIFVCIGIKIIILYKKQLHTAWKPSSKKTL